MAEQTTSLADVIKRNNRLKAHAKAATNSTGNRNYAGPAGDLVCKFAGLKMISKDSNLYAILEFRVDGSIDGQQSYNGAVCSILNSLSDSNRSTAEQGLERLMVDIQRLGVTTADREISAIEKDVVKLVGTQFIISAVPGKTGDRMYFNLRNAYIIKSEWTEEETEAAQELESNDSVEDLDTPEAEDVIEEVEDSADSAKTRHEDYEPSQWIGYEVGWTNPKTKKELTYTVVDADDAAKTVVLELDGKRVRVKYTDLNLMPF